MKKLKFVGMNNYICAFHPMSSSRYVEYAMLLSPPLA